MKENRKLFCFIFISSIILFISCRKTTSPRVLPTKDLLNLKSCSDTIKTEIKTELGYYLDSLTVYTSEDSSKKRIFNINLAVSNISVMKYKNTDLIEEMILKKIYELNKCNAYFAFIKINSYSFDWKGAKEATCEIDVGRPTKGC